MPSPAASPAAPWAHPTPKRWATAARGSRTCRSWRTAPRIGAAGWDLMASRNAVGAGGVNHQKRKPDIMLPLFTRPGMYPDPHSPFAVSPLPGRGGVLNVPISPALSLTPTLFSYSPSPGLSPFTGSSCFSFNPEEMKHYLHSQACSVFNYHLSPRTFPRYPLMVPPLQCQVPLEEQPQFPIKLQPPPVGRKNRERLESAEEPAAPQLSAPPPPRVKVEPALDKEAEPEEPPAKGKDKTEREEGSGVEEEKGPVFARPAAPSWHPAPPAPTPAEEPQEQGENSREKAPPREPAGDAGAQEKREDALMPPKLRLKRRWNGDRQADCRVHPPLVLGASPKRRVYPWSKVHPPQCVGCTPGIGYILGAGTSWVHPPVPGASPKRRVYPWSKVHQCCGCRVAVGPMRCPSCPVPTGHQVSAH
ncbi:ets variant 3 [Columba livia]|uniref:Ets variant 3 n=1 Tax=Columba livia TaxID=8932 RepID=A0A2I0LJI1_COLLI|nr:ets variant 3 [Columba livia]